MNKLLNKKDIELKKIFKNLKIIMLCSFFNLDFAQIFLF